MSAPASSSSGAAALKAGNVKKKGKLVWSSRKVTLTSDSIDYGKGGKNAGTLKGVPLRNILSIEAISDTKFSIVTTGSGKDDKDTSIFEAESKDECASWVSGIEDAVKVLRMKEGMKEFTDALSRKLRESNRSGVLMTASIDDASFLDARSHVKTAEFVKSITDFNIEANRPIFDQICNLGVNHVRLVCISPSAPADQREARVAIEHESSDRDFLVLFLFAPLNSATGCISDLATCRFTFMNTVAQQMADTQAMVQKTFAACKKIQIETDRVENEGNLRAILGSLKQARFSSSLLSVVHDSLSQLHSRVLSSSRSMVALCQHVLSLSVSFSLSPDMTDESTGEPLLSSITLDNLDDRKDALTARFELCRQRLMDGRATPSQMIQQTMHQLYSQLFEHFMRSSWWDYKARVNNALRESVVVKLQGYAYAWEIFVDETLPRKSMFIIDSDFLYMLATIWMALVDVKEIPFDLMKKIKRVSIRFAEEPEIDAASSAVASMSISSSSSSSSSSASATPNVPLSSALDIGSLSLADVDVELSPASSEMVVFFRSNASRRSASASASAAPSSPASMVEQLAPALRNRFLRAAAGVIAKSGTEADRAAFVAIADKVAEWKLAMSAKISGSSSLGSNSVIFSIIWPADLAANQSLILTTLRSLSAEGFSTLSACLSLVATIFDNKRAMEYIAKIQEVQSYSFQLTLQPADFTSKCIFRIPSPNMYLSEAEKKHHRITLQSDIGLEWIKTVLEEHADLAEQLFQSVPQRVWYS